MYVYASFCGEDLSRKSGDARRSGDKHGEIPTVICWRICTGYDPPPAPFLVHFHSPVVLPPTAPPLVLPPSPPPPTTHHIAQHPPEAPLPHLAAAGGGEQQPPPAQRPGRTLLSGPGQGAYSYGLRILTPPQIQFNDQPDVYNRFLDVMKEFKGQV